MSEVFLAKNKREVMLRAIQLYQPKGLSDYVIHERIGIAAITGIFLNRSSPAKVLYAGTSCIIQDLREYAGYIRTGL